MAEVRVATKTEEAAIEGEGSRESRMRQGRDAWWVECVVEEVWEVNEFVTKVGKAGIKRREEQGRQEEAGGRCMERKGRWTAQWRCGR